MSRSGTGALAALAALIAAIGLPRSARACDDGCDATCGTCCSLWQVSAVCGTRVLVDSAFARFSIADRVARSLNEQAASCVPSTGSCESARIECPGGATVATWKATCEPEARLSGSLPTSPLRAELVQADRLRRAEIVAIASASAWLEDFRSRADVKQAAKSKAASLAKDLEKARKELADHDAPLATALVSPASPDDAAALLRRVTKAEDRVADGIAKVRGLVEQKDSFDRSAADKRDKADRDARERAARKAREADEKAARAAEKAARADAERAARDARAAQTRADKEAREAQARADKEAREAQARTYKEAREAQARADKEARAAQAEADRAAKAAAASSSLADRDASALREAKEARTDALATVARASSAADAALLALVKLQAGGGLDKSADDTARDARKRLEDAKSKLSSAFTNLKATESEPSGEKQRDAVKKLATTAAQLEKSVQEQSQRVKEIVQRRAAGH